ncbi:zinc ribbon domain-containing protein [Arcobacter roscoffensis]|uniref:Zinc ribbon domain-containing protein n=1 Tax=Arcobacter roscoffensis TaxID=2961520 RepID=A0ABY5E9I6_9BACT|nr:zinc ribbon domain-containing protein [Arcobacter roscoffensis]UTJ07385.1 zinc ribbon domain-containing protein [Arcobacter roscoffensis]
MKEVFKNFYKNNFVFKGKEKLSKLAIIFIVLLDLFVFSILQMGVDFQVKVLNSPYNSYNSTCKNIVTSSKIESLNSYYYTNENRYKYNTIQKENISSKCKEVISLIDNVKKEHSIKELRKTKRLINKELASVNTQINFYRQNYNTSLFENIQTQNKEELNSEVKDKYNNYLAKRKELNTKINQIDKNFASSKSVKKLSSYINENKELIKEDYKAKVKAYEVKKDLITLAFLLPLLLVSFFAMKKYMLKENYILYIIAKNVLVIVSIPTVVSFISLVYTLLPKVFFEKLMRFFANLEIPFVVYYFALAVLVVVFTFIIIRVQKKYKESNSQFQNTSMSKIESYNKSICNNCNNKINYETMNFCPNCQNKIRVKCKACGDMTVDSLKYCSSCGEEHN